MANPSGRIGREGEHKTSAYLALAGFIGVEREGRRKPSLDNIAENLTTPVETKRRAKWEPQAWARLMRARHGKRWGLFMLARDARRADSPPDVVMYPAAFGAKLLYVYERVEEVANTNSGGFRLVDAQELMEESA